jgi:hypothetical protein
MHVPVLALLLLHVVLDTLDQLQHMFCAQNLIISTCCSAQQGPLLLHAPTPRAQLFAQPRHIQRSLKQLSASPLGPEIPVAM